IPLLFGLRGGLIGLPEEARDPTIWAASAAGLGVVVWGVVEYLRAHILKTLDGVAVTFTALIVGVGLAGGLNLGGFLQGGPVEWIGFGLAAALGSSIGDLALKKAVGKSSAGA